jgi:hypothetical protein
MAEVYSIATTKGEIIGIQKGIGNLNRILNDAASLEDYLKSNLIDNEAEIDTRVQALLTSAGHQRDHIIAELLRLDFQHQIVIRTGRDMTSVAINATDTSDFLNVGPGEDYRGRTTFSVWSPGGLRGYPYTGSPFSAFHIGDTITTSGAHLAGNNKTFIVHYMVVDSDVECLVASEAITGAVDDANDTSIVFTLVDR